MTERKIGSPRQRENGSMDGHPQRGIKKVIMTTEDHIREKGREVLFIAVIEMFPLEQEGTGLLAASFGTGQLGLREGMLVSGSGGLGRLRPVTRRSRRCSSHAGALSDWRGRSDGNAAWRKTVGSLASGFHAALTL